MSSSGASAAGRFVMAWTLGSWRNDSERYILGNQSGTDGFKFLRSVVVQEIMITGTVTSSVISPDFAHAYLLVNTISTGSASLDAAVSLATTATVLDRDTGLIAVTPNDFINVMVKVPSGQNFTLNDANVTLQGFYA